MGRGYTGFVLAGLAALPFGKGGRNAGRAILNRMLSDWPLNGSLRWQSGLPFAVVFQLFH
jgi:hypothetical protein